MGSIKMGRQMSRLPTPVISQLRSSTILSDVAQISDELVCNSLDAGATKIQVGFDGEALYMRVDDNGCGISREDLTLVGQRHATSKLHCLDELEEGVDTLGFRGEALSALSDIAVVEITSRCKGMPNTYRKILKGCSTVSIGVCREQQTTHGTTVIVRDMFYNQPVRRRHLNSSRRKTMQSIKERIMHFVLIHSQVSFTVTDLARNEVVLITKAALTLSHTLFDMFGEDLFTRLKEIDYAQGYLRLTGFLSINYHCHPSKDLQYFYINRRYVLKTAIHKLLNSWVGPNNFNHGGNCDKSLEKINYEADKSGKAETFTGQHLRPVFVLNMTCPLSDYDITFEASKTLVEFKDWIPAVSFMKSVLQMIWGNESSCKKQGIPRCPQGSSSVPKKKKSNIDNTYLHTNSKDVFSCKNNVPPMAVRRALVQSSSSSPCSSTGDLIGQEKANDSLNGTLTQVGLSSRILSPSLIFDSNPTAKAPHFDTLLKSKETKNNPKKFQTGCDTLLLRQTGHMTPCGQEKTSCQPGIQFELILEEASPKNLKFSFLPNADDYLSSLSTQTLSPSSAFTPPSSFFKGNSTTFKNDQCMNSPLFPSSSPQIDKHGSSWGTSMKQSIGSDPCGDSASDVEWKHLAPVEDMDMEPRKTWLEPGDFQVTKPLWSGIDDSFDGKRIPDASNLPNTICSSSMEGTSRGHASHEWSLPEIDSDQTNVDVMWRSTAKTKRRRLKFMANSYDDNLDDLFSTKSCSFSPDSINHSDSTLVGKPNYITSKWNAGEDTEEIASGVNPFKHCSKNMSNETHDCLFMTLNEDHLRVQSDDYDPEINSYEPLPKKRLNLVFNDGLGHLKCSTDDDDEEEEEENAIKRDKLGNDSGLKVRRTKKYRSGPPFYRPPARHSVHLNPLNSLSTAERMVNNSENAVAQATDIDVVIQTTSCVNKVWESRLNNLNSEDMVEHELSLDRAKCSKTPAQMNPIQCCTQRATVVESADTEKSELLMSTVKEMFKEWSNPCLKKDEDVLDLSSGILASSSGSLLPRKITKDVLKHARVLRQVDTKFIAAVACDILLLVDQHAADERVRLEELRDDVLSGNHLKQSFLLSSSQELTISLIEQQMLQTYHQQIEEWGWCWKLVSGKRSLGSSSTGGICKALLSSVPCIMGVNLTAGDLTEYLHQLIDTGGSSAPPPAVIKVLNYKACRGSIMFGDTLLPAECNQLIEHLKKTSLCFQCAHGRPTMVPIVDLRALQERLDQTSSNSRKWINDAGEGLIELKNNNSSHDKWHGLETGLRPSLERAKARLRQAQGSH